MILVHQFQFLAFHFSKINATFSSSNFSLWPTFLRCKHCSMTIHSRIRFNHTELHFHCVDSRSSAEKYKALLAVLEKLHLAMVELGFAPTESRSFFSVVEFIEKGIVVLELQQTLLEVSFRVMPFHRFVAAIDQDILNLTYDFVHRIVTSRPDSVARLMYPCFPSSRIRWSRSEILCHSRTTDLNVTRCQFGKKLYYSNLPLDSRKRKANRRG